MSTRMTCGSAPGTGISRAHSSGTDERPISRAATAGNSASRSGVKVKMQLTRSSVRSALRDRISRISASVAVRIASAVFSVTVLAPRSATSFIGLHSTKRAQALNLRRRQLAVLAHRQAADAQRAERGPLELEDRVPDGLEHALDLPLAPLVDRELDHTGTDLADLRGGGQAVVEQDALAQRLHRGLVDRRVGDPRAVGARHLEGGVGEAVGELAVVGQQDQTGGVVVQPADGVEPLGAADEFD